MISLEHIHDITTGFFLFQIRRAFVRYSASFLIWLFHSWDASRLVRGWPCMITACSCTTLEKFDKKRCNS